MKRFILCLIAMSMFGCASNETTNPIQTVQINPLPDVETPISVPATEPTTVATTIVTTTTTEPFNLADFAVAWDSHVQQSREMYGNCGEWHDLAMSVGWTDAEWSTLSRVLFRESRCQPDAWNGHDAGLTQINQIHKEWALQMGFNHPDDFFDPATNLLFARRLYETSGWKPWRYINETSQNTNP